MVGDASFGESRRSRPRGRDDRHDSWPLSRPSASSAKAEWARSTARATRCETGQHQGPRGRRGERCSTSGWRKRWIQAWGGLERRPPVRRTPVQSALRTTKHAPSPPRPSRRWTSSSAPPRTSARGRPVDHRADIWAFGVVLAEMLTVRALSARVLAGSATGRRSGSYMAELTNHLRSVAAITQELRGARSPRSTIPTSSRSIPSRKTTASPS